MLYKKHIVFISLLLESSNGSLLLKLKKPPPVVQGPPPPTVSADDCSYLCALIVGGCPTEESVPQCVRSTCSKVYKRNGPKAAVDYVLLPEGQDIPAGGSAIRCSDAAMVSKSKMLAWTAPLSGYAKGIKNFGASCFINAFIQIFVHLPPVQTYVERMKAWLAIAKSNEQLMHMINDPVDPALMPEDLRAIRRNHKEQTRRHLKILDDFFEFYDQMFNPIPDFVNPIDNSRWYWAIVPDSLLRSPGSWGGYQGFQEDSGQAFESFLKDLTKPTNSKLFKWAGRIRGIPRYRGDLEGIASLFTIRYREASRCEACGTIHTKPREFQRVFTLAFPDDVNDAYKAALRAGTSVKPKPTVSLSDMFAASLPLGERSDEPVECHICQSRLAPRDRTKKLPRHYRSRTVELVGPSPPILVLAINRIVTVKNPFKQSKIDAIVDMRPSRVDTGGVCDLDLGAMPHSQAAGCYRLVGIVVHGGGVGGGHYYSAYLDERNAVPDKWIEANDQSVRMVGSSDDFIRSKASGEAVAVYRKIAEHGPPPRLAAVVVAPPLPVGQSTGTMVGDGGVVSRGVKKTSDDDAQSAAAPPQTTLSVDTGSVDRSVQRSPTSVVGAVHSPRGPPRPLIAKSLIKHKLTETAKYAPSLFQLMFRSKRIGEFVARIAPGMDKACEKTVSKRQDAELVEYCTSWRILKPIYEAVMTPSWTEAYDLVGTDDLFARSQDPHVNGVTQPWDWTDLFRIMFHLVKGGMKVGIVQLGKEPFPIYPVQDSKSVSAAADLKSPVFVQAILGRGDTILNKTGYQVTGAVFLHPDSSYSVAFKSGHKWYHAVGVTIREISGLSEIKDATIRFVTIEN